jgi:hypothetical protein
MVPAVVTVVMEEQGQRVRRGTGGSGRRSCDDTCLQRDEGAGG